MVQNAVGFTRGHQPAPVGRHWLGAPVREFQGPLAEVAKYIPEFDRRPFVSPGDGAEACGISPYHDVILRLPTALEPFQMPVGIVSKSYRLVQHRDVLSTAVEAFGEVGIDALQCTAKLEITEHGERMTLSLELPGTDERCQFKIRGSDSMGLRLHFFNSVEGSTRFMAVLGWLRFVCYNGLIVGSAVANLQRVHTRALDLDQVGEVLRHGLEMATEEKRVYERWQSTSITEDGFTGWVDGTLKGVWGVKAAARAYHIATTGRDASFSDPFEQAPPSQRSMVPANPVPGAFVPADTAFAVGQVLSWLAGQRREVQERFEWQSQIPTLIEELITAN